MARIIRANPWRYASSDSTKKSVIKDGAMLETNDQLPLQAWPQLPLLALVGVGGLICSILLLLCCGDSSSKPDDGRKGGGRARESKEGSMEKGERIKTEGRYVNIEAARRQEQAARSHSPSRRDTSSSDVLLTEGYLNVPIPIDTSGSGAATLHTYLNANAAGTKFQPVGFNVNKVLGTLKKELKPYTLEETTLQLHEVIGKGTFGLVYKGTYKINKGVSPLEVAVKTVHGEDCSPGDMKSFLEEVVRMCGFQHPNVQSTIGLVFKSGQPYAIMPFMELGDLRSFIVSADNVLTLRRLLEFGLQIAKGMEYLSGKKFVHRDLAARNCMINKDHVIKVADFGLSRDMFNSDYYRMTRDNKTPLPVRWMAVESMENRVFTTKTDAWSFGVVLWELMTRGQTPYPRLPSLKVIDYVKGGGRPEKAHGCPQRVYDIMECCWQKSPEKRPTFTQLVNKIHTVLGGGGGQSGKRK